MPLIRFICHFGRISACGTRFEEIVCKGKKITVKINGKEQNECTCKFTDGYIALQSEGGPIEFRNIYIVE